MVTPICTSGPPKHLDVPLHVPPDAIFVRIIGRGGCLLPLFLLFLRLFLLSGGGPAAPAAPPRSCRPTRQPAPR